MKLLILLLAIGCCSCTEKKEYNLKEICIANNGKFKEFVNLVSSDGLLPGRYNLCTYGRQKNE